MGREMSPRIQSSTDRDIHGIAAKKEREAAPEEFANEEDSMAHDVPVRKEIRAKRDTKERLGKVEEKQDKLEDKVSAIHGDVREMRGELKTALSLIAPERKEVHTTERHRIDSRTKIIIAIVGAVGTAIGVVVGSGCV